MKTDKITITVTGPKKFRQEIINAIYKAAGIENEEMTQPAGSAVSFSSTMPPTDETEEE